MRVSQFRCQPQINISQTAYCCWHCCWLSELTIVCHRCHRRIRSWWFCCNSVWAAAVPITRVVLAVACCNNNNKNNKNTIHCWWWWCGSCACWYGLGSFTTARPFELMPPSRVRRVEHLPDIIDVIVVVPIWDLLALLLQVGDASDMTSAYNFWGVFPGFVCVRPCPVYICILYVCVHSTELPGSLQYICVEPQNSTQTHRRMTGQ